MCVDKHQRKIKLHSSLNEITVSELNEQIDKLNLNNSTNSFVNVQYRSKPTIVTSNDCTSPPHQNESLKFFNQTNLNDQSHKKSLPDLLNNQNEDCQASSVHHSFVHSQAISRKGQLIERALPEFRSTTTALVNESIFNANLNSLMNEQANVTNEIFNRIPLDNLPNTAPKLPFKNDTMNYCNIAHIVETNKCNQISICLAPPLPPKKLPTKHASLQISRKIDFNKLSDLKFDNQLNQN